MPVYIFFEHEIVFYNYCLYIFSERDLIPLFATFLASLWLGVEIGIVIGVAVDFCFLLYFNARPHVTIEKLPVYTFETTHKLIVFSR